MWNLWLPLGDGTKLLPWDPPKKNERENNLKVMKKVWKKALPFLLPSLAWLIDPFLLAVVRGVWIPGSVLAAMADPLLQMVLLAIAGKPVIAGPPRDDSDPVVDFSTGGMSLWLLESSFASSGPLVGFWFWNVNVQEPVKSQWPNICLRVLVGAEDFMTFGSPPSLQSPVWGPRQLSSMMLWLEVWLFCGSCGFVSGLSYQLSWKV